MLELGWQISGDRPGFTLCAAEKVLCLGFFFQIHCFRVVERGLIAQECDISQFPWAGKSFFQCFLECVLGIMDKLYAMGDTERTESLPSGIE